MSPKNTIKKGTEQIGYVESFEDLLSTSFSGDVNALCWERKRTGNFEEIINKATIDGDITEVSVEDLNKLDLTAEGELAREILLNDLKTLKDFGASPILNIIKQYERDDVLPFFSTDVYSFHVDRSPVPVDTFLCTYHGTSSEILPNSHAIQKIQMPEIREKLKALYDGSAKGFDAFLTEHFFDLHYQSISDTQPVKLGLINMCKIAVDHPESEVLPCVHRAPLEKNGQPRLLLIC